MESVFFLKGYVIVYLGNYEILFRNIKFIFMVWWIIILSGLYRGIWSN